MRIPARYDGVKGWGPGEPWTGSGQGRFLGGSGVLVLERDPRVPDQCEAESAVDETGDKVVEVQQVR